MPKEIPERFIQKYSDIVDDPDEFISSLYSMLPKSFRINPLKGDRKETLQRLESYGLELTKINWYEDAFISGSPDIGETLEHFLGGIYVQELVSMLPPLLVRAELEDADKVLDACAAPGSKTTQIAALMENKGQVIANDLAYTRIRALRFNLEKTGTLNTVITNYDLRHFPKMQFDVVILDAPCSAEGTIRKSYNVFSQWSEKHINKLARMQKQLITKGFDLLAPGGAMVYSTCTFAPEENESVVSHLINEREAKLEKIEVPGMRLSSPLKDWKDHEFDNEVSKAVRIWPHHNDTGGFFLAKVVK